MRRCLVLIVSMVISFNTYFLTGCGYGGPRVSKTEFKKFAAMASVCIYDHTFGIGMWYLMYNRYLLWKADYKETDFQTIRASFLCVTNAKSCEEMMACITPSTEVIAACQSSYTNTICMGDLHVDCWGSPTMHDCTNVGLTCVQGVEEAFCGADTCSPAQQTTYCAGDLVVSCSSGFVFVVRDCSFGGKQGGTCRANQSGFAECVGTGPVCDPMMADHCDGSTVVRCMNGKESRLDCQDLGGDLTCRDDEGGIDCDFKYDECRYDTPETCENGVITFCAENRFDTLDCKEYGYASCALTDNGWGAIVGFCVP